jgi:DNA polymerase I-like protein with 3'-5' exonuclease and polymerase domains
MLGVRIFRCSLFWNACRLNKRDAVITTDEREKTKRVVYAMMYGAGSQKLAEILEVKGDEANYIINSFNSYLIVYLIY